MSTSKQLVFRLLGLGTVVVLATCTDDRGPLEPVSAKPEASVESPTPSGGEIRVSRVIERSELGSADHVGHIESGSLDLSDVRGFGVDEPQGVAVDSVTGRIFPTRRRALKREQIRRSICDRPVCPV